EPGARAFAKIVGRFGFRCTPVTVEGCLHLKSVVNYLGDGWMAVDERYEGLSFLGPYRLARIPAIEEYAANCIRINDRVIIPDGFPASRKVIESAGLETVTVEMSEFMKMDGGVSCLSLRF
ncbi:MAG TPA: hypothetical protein VLA34_01165, partial [Candidatus Krumholzibacterium sp.]|nr:hypothetical protein [Candidatus Krumholzibacterium sp.]